VNVAILIVRTLARSLWMPTTEKRRQVSAALILRVAIFLTGFARCVTLGCGAQPDGATERAFLHYRRLDSRDRNLVGHLDMYHAPIPACCARISRRAQLARPSRDSACAAVSLITAVRSACNCWRRCL